MSTRAQLDPASVNPERVARAIHVTPRRKSWRGPGRPRSFLNIVRGLYALLDEIEAARAQQDAAARLVAMRALATARMLDATDGTERRAPLVRAPRERASA